MITQAIIVNCNWLNQCILICGGLILTLQDLNGKLTTYDARFSTFELIIVVLDDDYLANEYVY